MLQDLLSRIAPADPHFDKEAYRARFSVERGHVQGITRQVKTEVRSSTTGTNHTEVSSTSTETEQGIFVGRDGASVSVRFDNKGKPFLTDGLEYLLIRKDGKPVILYSNGLQDGREIDGGPERGEVKPVLTWALPIILAVVLGISYFVFIGALPEWRRDGAVTTNFWLTAMVALGLYGLKFRADIPKRKLVDLRWKVVREVIASEP